LCDASHGPLVGLLSGLTQLNCSLLTLKELRLERVAGTHRLLAHIVREWSDDIKNNQIPRFLGGVGPMHSVLQLLQGLRDLVVLPLEQYQKDGRIMRGLQRGAGSFTSSTAVSLLELTHKLLGAVKFAAEVAFEIMSPEGAVVVGRRLPTHLQQQHGASRAVAEHQIGQRPSDVREGVFAALEVVRQGVADTGRSLAEAVRREQERGRGVSGMVGGVLREAPSAFLARPVITAADATRNVVEGLAGAVAPDVRKEEEEKWKSPRRQQ